MKYEPIPNYGTHMTIKKFISDVKSGCLMDFDGHGYYATKDKMTDKIILPSHITGKQRRFSMKTRKSRTVKIKKIVDKRFGYVVWFNK